MKRSQERKLFIAKVLVLLLSIITIFLVYLKVNTNKLYPEFYLNGDENVTMNVNTKYEEKGYVFKFNNKDFSDNVKVESNLNTDKIGSYTIKYSYYLKYLKLGKTLERKIYVIDTVSPIIKVDSNKEVNLYVGDNYELPKYTATDNIDGDITTNVKVESNVNLNAEGNYQIKYLVEDSSHNSAVKTIIVHVKEKQKKAYIEVSISNQKLNYYEYGQVVLTSDIVTGINNGTPTGKYKVLNKLRSITLRGSGYNSFVNYWIAFIGSSYGFHDASWRDEFGGTIYKTRGSHGCVNMPYSSVAKLYDLVDIGTPVYINN